MNKSEIGELQNLMENMQQSAYLREMIEMNDSLKIRNEELEIQLGIRDETIRYKYC